jgi:hypothetical protein
MVDRIVYRNSFRIDLLAGVQKRSEVSRKLASSLDMSLATSNIDAGQRDLDESDIVDCISYFPRKL